MPPRRSKQRPAGRASVHVTIAAEVAARLRAYAGWHSQDMGAVVEDALRAKLKGFGVRIDAPAPAEPAGEGATSAGEAQPAR